ncbi:Protein phosphatase 2C family protein [Perilla frutescens var. hirtella]|uniref:protein-serine/threonine phosphatase n=1 Tax=Perilla frutescens var. hirtella TaxID=608512 RepID=A0AAD4ITP1_PERFH|nr:Protein phosphatase 2C family protein [Perilla frutescens var. hirtella]KAH6821360.1 Protein phosphatase 2C family protein [Perilla frutescens var. hirtella]
MAGDADCSTDMRGDHSKDNGEVSAVKDEILENENDLKQTLCGKPPRHLSIVRHSMSTVTLVSPTDSVDYDLGGTGIRSPSDVKSSFLPVFRSGSCAEKGPKPSMEDVHVCIDNLPQYLGEVADVPSPGAFYGVFDGHGGIDAASFIKDKLLQFIVEDSCYPVCLERAIKSAFLKADYAFADDSSLDISSGTTVLTAFISGRKMIVANAGDCRAVLGKRGRAIEMSRDHKPNYTSERIRIEKLGGAIYDGYLNGQLSVSRALGDWHMKGPKGSASPLSAEPELQEMLLTEDDEFLILGCDGLWEVMSSQCAVTMARKELMLHNDPERCSRELVREALKRDTCDNLTVVVICFSPDPPPRIEIAPTRVRRSISAEALNLLKGALEGN